MGIIITTEIVCDNCSATIEDLPYPDTLPSGWMNVEGFANISGGASLALEGYFCSICVGDVPAIDLVKKAADVSPALSEQQE